jgi:hypothetical protein
VGYAGGNQPYFPVWLEGRGKWANISVDPSGNITLNSVGTYRTPWFTQSDMQLSHEIKVNKNNEAQVLGFEVNVTNLFNQRSVTAYWDGVNSLANNRALYPSGEWLLSPGNQQTYMSPYNWVDVFNNNYIISPANPRPVIANSQYGKPYLFQQSRSIRLQIRFTF